MLGRLSASSLMDPGSSFTLMRLSCTTFPSLFSSGALPFTCLGVLDEANHCLATDRMKLFVVVSLEVLPLTLLNALLDFISEISNKLFGGGSKIDDHGLVVHHSPSLFTILSIHCNTVVRV